MTFDLSTITPSHRQAWAAGTIKTRIEIDDMNVQETIIEQPNNVYNLRREKRGSTRLKLMEVIVPTIFDTLVGETVSQLT